MIRRFQNHANYLHHYEGLPTMPTNTGSIHVDADAVSGPPLRVIAIRDLLYCERLFYLTEVENIQCPNEHIYAGWRLHVERLPLDDETPELRSLEVSSEAWGIFGKVDAVRRRDGAWVAYEHKRGRCRRGDDNEALAWPSDRIQAIAYSVLIEEDLGEPVREARVRYHADNVTAFVTIDEQARLDLKDAVARAHELRQTMTRPPVTTNERLCTSCSLAPVCLPEEERLADRVVAESVDGEAEVADETATGDDESPQRESTSRAHKLPVPLPAHRERQTVHVTARKAYVSKRGESLTVSADDTTQVIPIAQVDGLVIHGHGQISTQALHLCAQHGISVQWMTFGGRFMAGTTDSPGRVQQRIRQYQGLSDPSSCLRLAQATVLAKVECQLRYLLRNTRGHPAARTAILEPLSRIRESLKGVSRARSLDSLRGLEGRAAKSYFAAIAHVLNERVPAELRPSGRTSGW